MMPLPLLEGQHGAEMLGMYNHHQTMQHAYSAPPPLPKSKPKITEYEDDDDDVEEDDDEYDDDEYNE